MRSAQYLPNYFGLGIRVDLTVGVTAVLPFSVTQIYAPEKYTPPKNKKVCGRLIFPPLSKNAYSGKMTQISN